MGILDYIERIKRENEGPRITAQEPRMGLKPGGIVEPGVTHYATELPPGIYKRGDKYRVIQQRGGGERYSPPAFDTLKEAKKDLANYIEKNPAAKQLVPEGSEKFLKTYLKERNLTSWTDLSKGQKANFIGLWPKVQKQQALIKGMIPASEMAERLGISTANLADLRKKKSIFHKKLVDLIGKPVNLVGAAGGTLAERGEYIYYNPVESKDLKIAQKYLPQQFGYISQDVTQRIKTLADDDWFMNRLKKVTSVDDFTKVLPLETVKARYPGLKLTDSKLSKAVVYLGQVMQGHVEYRGLEDIGLNKVIGNRISRMIEDAPFGNFFKKEAYDIAMSNIDRQFGHEVGTFSDYRKKIKAEFRRLGFKDFKKFNLDEYVGTSIGGWKKSGQFSVFSRLLEKNVNQKSGASYLGRLSQATDALEAAIADKNWKSAKTIVEANKADALRTIKKTKNSMPYLSLSAPGSKENFGVKRLNQLEAQGLGIKDFFKDRKYTYSGLGEGFTQKEVLSALEKGETGSLKGWKPTEKGFRELIEKVGCFGRVKQQGGGDIDCFEEGKKKIKTGQITAPGEKALFTKLAQNLGPDGWRFLGIDYDAAIKTKGPVASILRKVAETSSQISPTVGKVKLDPIKALRKAGKWAFGPVEMGLLPVALAGEALYANYANKRDLKKALDEIPNSKLPQYRKNLILEGYSQEARDIGGVGLESYALDQPNISGALEKIGYGDKNELMRDVAGAIAGIREQEERDYQEALKRAQREQFDKDQPMFASGGLANLTRTVAPDSGPMSQGLRSLYIDDMDY